MAGSDDVRGGDRPVIRSEERARLTALIDTSTGPPALVLVGNAGAGKSTLLAFAAALARRRGFVVATPDDPALRRRIGTAVRPRAVSGPRAVWSPTVITVDDAHELPGATLSALVALSQRADGERVVLLFTAPAGEIPVQLAGLPVCRLEPISASDAAILLDGQPDAPVGWARSEILRHVGGNPAAVVDFAACAGPSRGRVLTVPDRFRDAYDERVAALPDATVRLLLVAAAADGRDDVGAVLRAARTELSECEPAELSGLLTITADRVTFQDPALLLACYHGADDQTRRSAHAALAAAVAGDAERHAWHRAHSLATGEEVAALLEVVAEHASRAGRHVEATGALELAGLTAAWSERAARCFAGAARTAARAGHLRWCRDLAQRVAALSNDPSLLGSALAAVGQHLTLAGPGSVLLEQVHSLIDKAGTAPRVVVELVTAAVVQTLAEGDRHSQAALAEIATDAVAACLETESSRATTAVLTSAAVSAGRPPLPTDCADLLLPGIDDSELTRLIALGSAAWAGDDVAAAVRHLRRARELLSEDAAAAEHPLVYVLLADVLVEHGQWREAAQVHAEALRIAAAGGLSVLAAAVSVQMRALGQLRGESGRLPAWPTGPAARHRLVRALVAYTSGQAFAAVDDRLRAGEAFLDLFEPSGVPVHFGWTNRGIVALARAVATLEQRQAALLIVDRVRRSPDFGSPRVRALAVERATALLSGGAAEATLRAAVSDPVLADRPYQQAMAMLDRADWLRARRRFVAARPLLASAQELFARLGARRDEQATRARLRAAGVAIDVPGADGFAELTAQQQLIATLAASGLSNKVIADRLALSPRTVGSHLYQIYPKLGVASRHQLSDMLPGPV